MKTDRCSLTFAALMFICCNPSTFAAPEGGLQPQNVMLESKLKNARFNYKADGKRISDVLRDFAGSQGLPIIVDAKVEGLVSGNFATSPWEFLEGMTQAYSLIWYFDGTALFVYPASSIQSRIFRLKGYTEAQVLKMLVALKLDNTKYPIRFDRVNSTLLVYGPPRHVELVTMAIESLDTGAIEGNRRVIRIFRLQHASAGDRTLGKVQITGIASMLSRLYGGQGQRAADMLGGVQREAAKQMAPLNRALQQPEPDGRNRLMPDLKGISIASAADGAASPRSLKSPVEDDSEPDTATFEVDEPSNSIIAYCKASRMTEIATLIESLDTPAVLVELEATIIEVTTDGVNQLGIDWSLSSTSVNIGARPPDLANVDRVGSALLSAPYTLNTLLRDSGRALLANVNALEGKGKARIISKPRVLGLANRPAVMVEKRIANVRVSGNLEANLFQVEAGTTLQITPQVTAGENGKPATIKLSIFIEDGNFEGNSVDKIPVVKRTEIRTEARVLEGESLLVGGISIESESNSDAGVPKLKSLPFIGGLFRNSMQRSARLERLFLLTPRVIRSLPPLDAASTTGVLELGRAPVSTARAASNDGGLRMSLPIQPAQVATAVVAQGADPAQAALVSTFVAKAAPEMPSAGDVSMRSAYERTGRKDGTRQSERRKKGSRRHDVADQLVRNP